MTRSRQPAGAPTGGQFTATSRGESGTTLTATRPAPAPESLTIGLASRFHEVKLVSAVREVERMSLGPDRAYERGWALADADVALHMAVGGLPLDGGTREHARALLDDARGSATPGQTRCRRIPGRRVDELAAYTLREAVTAHHLASTTGDMTHEHWDAVGRRNAYAQSYAELTLRSVDNQDSQLVADRLTAALADGITDPTDLHDAAWNVHHLIDDLED